MVIDVGRGIHDNWQNDESFRVIVADAVVDAAFGAGGIGASIAGGKGGAAVGALGGPAAPVTIPAGSIAFNTGAYALYNYITDTMPIGGQTVREHVQSAARSIVGVD